LGDTIYSLCIGKKRRPGSSPCLRKERRYAPAAANLDGIALASSIATPCIYSAPRPFASHASSTLAALTFLSPRLCSPLAARLSCSPLAAPRAPRFLASQVSTVRSHLLVGTFRSKLANELAMCSAGSSTTGECNCWPCALLVLELYRRMQHGNK
jgi:hypothetical protein